MAAEPQLVERPLITLVVPVYGVAAYLPDFLAGLDDQGAPSDVELVFVDDGSPDASATMIETWIAAHPRWSARLLRQPNGGLCRARNTGLASARGDWVSFPDPDDRLEPGYLDAIRAMLARPEVDLACGNALIWDDAADTVTATHPLHRRFRRGDRVVDLQHHPETIHLQAATAFYRRDRIESAGLVFDPAIRPSFEDAAFTLRYLARHQPPHVGLVARARYRYRRRAAGSSLVQRSWAQPAKYGDVLEHGYLPVLHDLRRELGVVPLWAQNTVLYDLLFTFRREDRAPGLRDLVDPAWTPRFHELVQQVLALIDPETVEGFAVMRTSRQLRTALLAGYGGEELRPRRVVVTRHDPAQGLVEVRYVFTGPEPAETWHVAGAATVPCHHKTRDLPYLGRLLLRERICWLPARGDLRIWLDGHAAVLDYGSPPEPRYVAKLSGWRKELGTGRTDSTASRSREAPATPRASRRNRRAGPRAAVVDLRAGATAALRRAGSYVRARRRTPAEVPDPAPVGPDLTDAWVIGAETDGGPGDLDALWEWLRREHPEINAWRLQNERDGASAGERSGAEPRQVGFGSAEHQRLFANAAHVVVDTPDRSRWLPPGHKSSEPHPWRLSVLPGVWLDAGAGRWLSRTPLDRLVVATSAEQVALTGPGSPSPLTDREVRLTGYPRHDRLRGLATVAEPGLVLLDTAYGASPLTADGPLGELGSALHVLGRDEDPYAWLSQAAMVVTDRPWLALDAVALGRPVVGWAPGLADRWPEELGPTAQTSDELLFLVRRPPLVPDLGFGAPEPGAAERVVRSLLELDELDPRAAPGA